LPAGITVLGIGRRTACIRHASGKKIEATHMSKSAKAISDDGPLIRRKGIFSGLFTSHAPDPRISPKTGQVKDARDDILDILVDDAVIL
jgi:hypothetical protein